jgi:hypothetical protein
VTNRIQLTRLSFGIAANGYLAVVAREKRDFSGRRAAVRAAEVRSR